MVIIGRNQNSQCILDIILSFGNLVKFFIIIQLKVESWQGCFGHNMHLIGNFELRKVGIFSCPCIIIKFLSNCFTLMVVATTRPFLVGVVILEMYWYFSFFLHIECP